MFQLLDHKNVTSISSSFFNASSPTKVIIHGFASSCNNVWVRKMRLSFLTVVSCDSKKEDLIILNQEDCNVICVDWEAGAANPNYLNLWDGRRNYLKAAVNTRLVGRQVIRSQLIFTLFFLTTRWLCSSIQSTWSLGR